MLPSVRIYQLIPENLVVNLTRLGPDYPIMAACILMSLNGSNFIPVEGVGKGLSKISSREIIGLMDRFEDDIFGRFVRDNVGKYSTLMGNVYHGYNIYEAVKVMEDTGFGGLCVLNEYGEVIGIVTLREVLRFLTSSLSYTGIRAADVASIRMVRIDRHRSIRDLCRLIALEGVDHVLVNDFKEPLVINVKEVIKYIFGNWKNLLMLKENPSSVLDQPIDKLPMLRAGRISANSDLYEAIATIYNNQAGCLLLKECEGIITPWDLVIKTVKALHAIACYNYFDGF